MDVSQLTARLKSLAGIPRRTAHIREQVARLVRAIETNNLLSAQMLIERVHGLGPRRRLRETEFKVFSQWGDDGIIQYLIHQVPLPNDTFIEFGVESYEESNTRFLLMNNNWRGLVMDGNPANIDHIRQGEISWRHDLTAKAAFITRENINDLIVEAGFRGPVGILSIDIDGNDYWVWEAIAVVNPAIVIVEYNAVFGPDRAACVPYDPHFVRSRAHWSNLFWGCSLAALCALAERKGFAFVGCNSNGNNAYFVQRGLASNLRELRPREGFVASRFRDSRDPEGRLTFVSGDARFALISDLMVTNITTGRLVRLQDA
jgi:hypothetical protein